MGLMGGLWSLIAALLLNIWVLKYCYVLIEQIADGATEPPVMDIEMLSPFESRPWQQAALLGAGVTLCYKLHGDARWVAAISMLLVFPASAALLGMGDNVFQAMNPLKWFRVIRGLGLMYVMLLAVLALSGVLIWLVLSRDAPLIVTVFTGLFCEVAFFGLIGAGIWIRRRPLEFEPSRSPERTAARAEAERMKERARMLDEMFQNSRMGKHVDATAPLARWLRDLDADYAIRDSLYVAEQSLKWQLPLALNPIGSTLIRHLMRYGRPDAALSVFEMYRRRSPQFTMDSAPDLRALADYAESVGRQELAQAMRLETPIHQPTV
jgi:pentatricopeptide repeat protein